MFSDIDSFYLDPLSVNVTEGDRVTLECVTGYSAPPAVLQWERDGQIVTQPSEDGYFGTVADGNAMLIISNL